MNKVTRMLAMTGMALAATATIGAGSAAAAPAKPDTTGHASQSADRWGSDTRIIGYYRSLSVCHRIGNLGEWRDRWDDHECYRSRGSWVLVAEWDRHGGWGDHDGRGHGGWGDHDGRGHGGWGDHDGRGHGGRGDHDGHGGRGDHDGHGGRGDHDGHGGRDH